MFRTALFSTPGTSPDPGSATIILSTALVTSGLFSWFVKSIVFSRPLFGGSVVPFPSYIRNIGIFSITLFPSTVIVPL